MGSMDESLRRQGSVEDLRFIATQNCTELSIALGKEVPELYRQLDGETEEELNEAFLTLSWAGPFNIFTRGYRYMGHTHDGFVQARG